MCGIIGYTGREEAAPKLLEGLKRLAYRGYDSAGIAVTQEGGIHTSRAAGKIDELWQLTKGGRVYDSTCGIGHTRWATHGPPTATNAHPHLSQKGMVAVVHNGIIENFSPLKEALQQKGYIFSSQTDTEVIPHLLETFLAQGMGCLDAILHLNETLTGAYALGILFSSSPMSIWAVKRKSPLVVALGADGTYLASDVTALLDTAKEVYYLEEGQVAHLTPDGVTFYSPQGREISLPPTPITWDAKGADKGSYTTYMEKELYEIPSAISRTIQGFFHQNTAPPCDIDSICTLACGSAYHAGMVGKYLLEDLLSLPVRCESASETRYHAPPLSKQCLALAISQSGETADTLEAVRQCQKRGHSTYGIVNVEGSSIARACDQVFYTQAGPEIAVATTKAYCAQVCTLYLFAAHLLQKRKKQEEASHLLAAIREMPILAGETLSLRPTLATFASKLLDAKYIFYIGRGMDYAVSMEGALKMREITYLDAQAYPAGELKHGTISLIEKDTPVVAVVTQPTVEEKTLSAIEEVRARGGRVFLIARHGLPSPRGVEDVVHLPPADPKTAPLLAAIAMQLLSYLVCQGKGLDPDQPRNLAKSVTVE